MVRKEGQQSPGKKTEKGDFWRFVGIASTVGINLVVSTFVGFALGFWVVDRYLDSFPWFTIVLTLLGITAGFLYLFRVARRAGGNDGPHHGSN